MIRKEFYKTRSDGVKLFRTYSDEGRIIKQVETDNEYSEAIDVEGSSYTYEETDKYQDVNTVERLDAIENAVDTLLGIKKG